MCEEMCIIKKCHIDTLFMVIGRVAYGDTKQITQKSSKGINKTKRQLKKPYHQSF